MEVAGSLARVCVGGGACVTVMVLGKRREKWEVGTARDREGEKGQKGPSLSPARTGTPATLPLFLGNKAAELRAR